MVNGKIDFNSFVRNNQHSVQKVKVFFDSQICQWLQSVPVSCSLKCPTHGPRMSFVASLLCVRLEWNFFWFIKRFVIKNSFWINNFFRKLKFNRNGPWNIFITLSTINHQWNFFITGKKVRLTFNNIVLIYCRTKKCRKEIDSDQGEGTDGGKKPIRLEVVGMKSSSNELLQCPIRSNALPKQTFLKLINCFQLRLDYLPQFRCRYHSLKSIMSQVRKDLFEWSPYWMSKLVNMTLLVKLLSSLTPVDQRKVRYEKL